MLIFRIVNNFDKCLVKRAECLEIQGIPPVSRHPHRPKLDILLDILYTTCYDIDREVKQFIEYREFSHNLNKEIDMSLTKFITDLGLNPADFADEIKALGDGDSWRDRYSYKGVFDIKIKPSGEKLFMFSFNEQNGSGPMSYWWTIEKLCDGKWVKVDGATKSYGCRHYPSKFPKT